ncbi:uncharacterized protein LOC143435525 isoform X2 [Arvicanthis niloticus]|uniref:uncharacterized protein LOC143309883 isoform X2 n=1 Tax=Arvicanthis niloticus TaxID=61156 RepID=UPI00402B9AB8
MPSEVGGTLTGRPEWQFEARHSGAGHNIFIGTSPRKNLPQTGRDKGLFLQEETQISTLTQLLLETQQPEQPMPSEVGGTLTRRPEWQFEARHSGAGHNIFIGTSPRKNLPQTGRDKGLFLQEETQISTLTQLLLETQQPEQPMPSEVGGTLTRRPEWQFEARHSGAGHNIFIGTSPRKNLPQTGRDKGLFLQEETQISTLTQLLLETQQPEQPMPSEVGGTLTQRPEWQFEARHSGAGHNIFIGTSPRKNLPQTGRDKGLFLQEETQISTLTQLLLETQQPEQPMPSEVGGPETAK